MKAIDKGPLTEEWIKTYALLFLTSEIKRLTEDVTELRNAHYEDIKEDIEWYEATINEYQKHLDKLKEIIGW